jgi:hypothetical protein
MEPMFIETLQIALVVHDLDARMRAYVHEYGIGPWEIYEFNPDSVADMVKDGRPAEYAFRLAVTMVGSVQWELIQPLDDKSMYAEFLNTKGEGLHHVAGVRTTRPRPLTARPPGAQGGLYSAPSLPVDHEDLGVITEIFDWPEASSRRRTPCILTRRPRRPAGSSTNCGVHDRARRPADSVQAVIISLAGCFRPSEDRRRMTIELSEGARTASTRSATPSSRGGWASVGDSPPFRRILGAMEAIECNVRAGSPG